MNHILSIDLYSPQKNSPVTHQKTEMDSISFSQSGEDSFRSLCDPLRTSSQGQETTPGILDSEEILNWFPKIPSKGDFHPSLEFAMLPVPDVVFEDTEDGKDSSISLSLNVRLNTEDLLSSDCVNNLNCDASSYTGTFVQKLKDGKEHEHDPISNIEMVSKNVSEPAPKYNKGGPRKPGTDEACSLLLNKSGKGDVQAPVEFSMFPFPDRLFDNIQRRKDESMSLSLNAPFDTQDILSLDCMNSPHGFGSSGANNSVEKSKGEKEHESAKTTDLEIVSNHIGEPASQYDNGGSEEPSTDEILRLFSKNPSTTDCQQSLKFPMFPVPEGLCDDTQEKKCASMGLSLNAPCGTQDILSSDFENKPKVLGSSLTGTLVQKSGDTKEHDLLPVSNIEVVSKNLGEVAPHYGNGGPGEPGTRENETDILDCLLSSLIDFQNEGEHMPGVLPCDTKPNVSETFKTTEVDNDLLSKKTMTRVRQTTSTPHLRVIPFIKKGGRRFQCKYCDVTFTRRGNCERHLDSVHNKIKRFECPTCSMKYSTKQNMRAHQKTHFRNRIAKRASQKVNK